MKKNYKDLIAWQRAIDLVPKVYQLIKCFPVEENYALAAQMRRAVVSIAANIAEGQARQHRKEFQQRLSFARGSLAEMETLLIVASKLGYISEEELTKIEIEITSVAKPLSGLANSLREPI